MSTIQRSLAEKLIEGNGKSKFGTAGYCLVRYQNRTKYDIPNVNLYDPDAEINCFDYAIFTNKLKYEAFLESDTVGGVDILWASEKFKRDEIDREAREMADELSEGLGDLFDDYPTIGVREGNKMIKPSARER